jgi:hypothetical protein
MREMPKTSEQSFCGRGHEGRLAELLMGVSFFGPNRLDADFGPNRLDADDCDGAALNVSTAPF